MKHKKSIAALGICGLVLSIFLPLHIAQANSGVIESLNPPNYELRVDEGTPISVQKEDLLLEAYPMPRSSFFNITYELHNTSETSLTQPLLFPIITDIQSGLRLKSGIDEFALEKNGEPLPFDISFGEIVPEGATPDFEELLQGRKAPEAEHSDFLNQTVSVYDVEVQAPERGNIWLTASYPEGTSLIFSGASGSYSVDETRLSYALFQPAEDDNTMPWKGTIAVLKQTEPPVITAQSFENGEFLEGELEFTTTERNITLYEFLAYWMENHSAVYEDIYNDTVKPAVLSALGSSLEQYLATTPATIDMSIRELLQKDRAVFFSYELPMEADETATYHIRYGVQPTYLRGSMGGQEYEYRYLLNPAASWKDFKNLNITVQTDMSLRVKEDSVHLKKESNEIYTASFESLPDEDFVLRLSDTRYGYSGILWAGVALLLVIAGIIVFFRKGKRKRTE